MDDKELARLAYTFLRRATMRGDEVQSFLAVTQWLAKFEGTPDKEEKKKS